MAKTLRNWAEKYIRYSAEFWTVLACFIASLLFVLFQGGKLALMLFIIVSLLALYLGLGRWSGVAATRGTRTLVQVNQERAIAAGTSVSVRIDLRIPGIWPIPYVIVKDRLQRLHGPTLTVEQSAVPDWKRRGVIEYSTPPLRRGHYVFEHTDCSTEDVFGLFKHKGSIALDDSFRVMPQTIPIRDWRQFHQVNKGHHFHSATTRALRETTQINGVREYIYGDRISRIHWNATARTGTWKSKEFERESLPKTIVMIDRNEEAYASNEQFELAISTAASLFEYGQQQDLALGLLSVGADSVYLEPKRSPHQYKTVSNHFIDVEADGEYTLIEVLQDRAHHYSAGTFFVVISPRKEESISQTLNWIHQRQMNPCHLWIASERSATDRDEWTKGLKTTGYLGYCIQSLSELPLVLGGRMQ